MDADDVDDASQLYLRLHALGLSEDAAWATVLNGKALGLTDEDIFEDVSNPEGNGVRNHRDREVEEARDSTQGPARKMVQLPMRGSPLPESKLLLFREVHTRMYRSGDPVLRELGMQLKTMLDFYSASLTVIGCAARKFAEGLAGWMLVEHFPVEYPSIDVLRGYDEDGELQMMLGARLRALGGTVPKDVLKDIRLLKQLGNRECHDNDQRHRLQDAQKLEVVETTSRLGAAAVEGRFACRPKREERLCRNWVQGGSCKHGYHCAFKHASKCRFNHMCGGCTNDKCEHAHIAECRQGEDCNEESCLFDHTRKPTRRMGKGKGQGKGSQWTKDEKQWQRW